MENIGGIKAISQALIDDCSLAKAVKFQQKNKKKGGIWLGLTKTTISIRAYDELKTIWDTISRTAFTQLNYSYLLLFVTVAGMIVVYVIPLISLINGVIISDWLEASLGFITWTIMTIAYLPTIKLYKLSSIWAIFLPAIALLYTLMTINSAVKYWQGKGGNWKGRTYN